MSKLLIRIISIQESGIRAISFNAAIFEHPEWTLVNEIINYGITYQKEF